MSWGVGGGVVGGDQETDQWIPFRGLGTYSTYSCICTYHHTVHASQTTMHPWYMFFQPVAPKFDSLGASEANPV